MALRVEARGGPDGPPPLHSRQPSREVGLLARFGGRM